MRSLPLLLFALLLIILGFYAFLTLTPREKNQNANQAANESALSSPSPVTVLDPVRGDPRGSATIIEYGDYLCTACRATETVLGELLASVPGIRFVWRDFPIENLSAAAKRAAIAARCAQDQGKFWEYHDLLLSRDDQPSDPALVELADGLNLDSETFASCLQKSEREPLVDRFQEEALSLGLRGAPSFYINGLRYDGPLSAAGLSQAIDILK